MGTISRRRAKPAPGLLHGAFIVGPGNAALRAVLVDFTAEIDRAVGHVVELRVIGDPATSGPNAKAEDAAAGRRLARAKSSYGRSVAAHGTAERATSEEEADARRRLGLSLDDLPILRLYHPATGQSRNVALRGVPFGAPDVDRGFGHLLVDAFEADRVNASLAATSGEAFDTFVNDFERRIALVAGGPQKAMKTAFFIESEANVRFHDKTISVGHGLGLVFIRRLVDARGDVVSSKQIAPSLRNARFDRVCNRLPERVRNLVKRHRGSGYSIDPLTLRRP